MQDSIGDSARSERRGSGSGRSIFIGLDSPLGPIFLGYGLDDEGDHAVHLTFGSLLRP